jgi:hypothetical protein
MAQWCRPGVAPGCRALALAEFLQGPEPVRLTTGHPSAADYPGLSFVGQPTGAFDDPVWPGLRKPCPPLGRCSRPSGRPMSCLITTCLLCACMYTEYTSRDSTEQALYSVLALLQPVFRAQHQQHPGAVLSQTLFSARLLLQWRTETTPRHFIVLCSRDLNVPDSVITTS